MINSVNATLDKKINKSLSSVKVSPFGKSTSAGNSGVGTITMAQVKAEVKREFDSKIKEFQSGESSNLNINPKITYSTPNLTELGFEIDHSGNKIICNKKVEFKNAYDTIPEGTIIMWDKDNIGPLPTSCWTEVINLQGRISMGAGGMPTFNIKFKNTDTKIPFKTHNHNTNSAGRHSHNTRWYEDSNPITGEECNNYTAHSSDTDGADECPVGLGTKTSAGYNRGMRMFHIDENGTHTHPITSSGRDGDNWTTNNLPPIYGVKFFKKQKCT